MQSDIRVFTFQHLCMHNSSTVSDVEAWIVHYMTHMQGKDTYMGSTQVLPDVCLDGRCPEHPELQWLKIQRNGHPAGELLAAFILFLTVSGRVYVAQFLVCPFSSVSCPI